jgi:hypothetical protein
MFERLLSAYECRCGSGAVVSIGMVLLLDDDHAAESAVEYITVPGFLVWRGYDPDGKTPKCTMGQSRSGEETAGRAR